MFSETGSDGDRITSDEKTFLEGKHADNSYLKDAQAFKYNAALLLQLDNITKELDYLRTKIVANEDKTTITSAQATAITANTAKVSLVGGTGTSLSFSEMIVTGSGSRATYSIIMTAVDGEVSKSVTLTLT